MNTAEYLNLLREMSISEFKLKDQSTVLGFLWTLLRPLLMFLVLYFLFTKWMGARIERYPLYLMTGIIQWNFFATGTSYALSSLIRRAELVKNLKFPREILVISSALTVFISHVFEMVILLLFVTAMGVLPGPYLLLLPVMMLVELLLVISVSLPLSTLCVYYRDIENVWNILIMAGFFLTPVFYSLSIVSGGKRRILMMNPITRIINASRDCLVYGRTPELRSIAVIIFAATLLFICGYAILKNREKYFGEIL